MTKEHLINKRHLEKMEETKKKKYFYPDVYLDWDFGYIGDRIPKRCRVECKKFNKCKLSKLYSCKDFEGWNND